MRSKRGERRERIIFMGAIAAARRGKLTPRRPAFGADNPRASSFMFRQRAYSGSARGFAE
jgi:hypothetical protein